MATVKKLDPVQPDELYPLQTFMELTGLGTRALRTMRRAGLKVRRVGGRGFILGRDFIEHLDEIGEADQEGN
ncbi:MAG: hypothetical protein KDA65_11300 [Planctomycetaceae bacterium]|nr:hypothetical protein [Planctomycetaceae bacterium]